MYFRRAVAQEGYPMTGWLILLFCLVALSGGSPASAAGGGASEAGASADVLQSFTIFDGRESSVFESGSGNPVQFDMSAGFVRITSSASDPGARVIIGPELAGR